MIENILITVKTYPVLSRKYQELVCYEFKDIAGGVSKLMVEDWEIGVILLPKDQQIQLPYGPA